MEPFSDFVFYADESGDHSLTSIDSTYPIFALALCAFHKRVYSRSIVPRFQALKFQYFGHDAIVLHEREIRKQIAPFEALVDMRLRLAFMADLSRLMHVSPFRIAGVVIDKRKIRQDLFPEHPYHVSLKISLQLAYGYLKRRKQLGRITYFIFEKRGEKEDKELELEFLRIVQGQNDLKIPFQGFRILLSDKRTNSTGMQIADLVARPMGLSILRPDQPNQTYDIIRRKLINGRHGKAESRGIHIP